MYGRYFFSADEVRAAGIEISWLEETGIVNEDERRRFAGLDFELDGERVSAGIKVDVEDEQGYIQRHNADWHDTSDVYRATLMDLIAHGRIRALAGQLSTVRSDEGISQAALAAALGLPKESGNVQISRWESVHRTPSLATLIQMGELLGMELGWTKK